MDTTTFTGRIVRLQSENYKRLKAVEITPEGNIVTIGGANGAGKSSVLDSIAAALGGLGAAADVPVRKGEARASILLDLGDLVVKRTFTAAGGTALKVLNKQGASFPSPQAMLDRLIGALAFDPLSFLRQKPIDQANILRRLVGVDTSEIDARRKQAYEERTLVGREADRLAGHAKSLPHHEEVPEMPVALTELSRELEAARATNRENQKMRAALMATEDSLREARGEVAGSEERIEELERQLQLARAHRLRLIERAGEVETQLAARLEQVKSLQDIDTKAILCAMGAAEATNEKVRANQRHDEAIEAALQKESERLVLTQTISVLDAERAKMIAGAPYPIPGLGFDEDKVSFNALPLAQASQAEQLRVSVAIGAALNQRLRVILVRDASLLDKRSMALLAELAAHYDLQVWCEVVSQEGVQVVIEDGSVREPVEAA